jgi:hypothetical protein
MFTLPLDQQHLSHQYPLHCHPRLANCPVVARKAIIDALFTQLIVLRTYVDAFVAWVL